MLKEGDILMVNEKLSASGKYCGYSKFVGEVGYITHVLGDSEWPYNVKCSDEKAHAFTRRELTKIPTLY